MAKYKNEKIVVDGIKFDSKVEAKYYEKLKEDKAKGLIKNFELQPKYTLIPKFERNGKTYRKIEYVADFQVYDNDWNISVIDIKGLATETAKLKRKLFEYNYPQYTLEWLVWNKGLWRDYDQVVKERKAKKVI